MKKITLVGALLAMLVPTALQGQAAFALDGLDPVEMIQESPDSATFEARWYYTPNQNWTVEYDYEVATTGGTMVFSGQTAAQTFQFTLPRAEADAQYSFRVRVMRLAPSPRNGPWSGDTFTVPAKVTAMIYALAAPTDTPYIVQDDPIFHIPQGTIWIEFTPDRVTDRQGLYSKDGSGYGTGGHFSLLIENGALNLRMQSDTATEVNITGGVVVDSVLNQAAVVFGSNGAQLWVNGALVASDPYNGGLEENTDYAAIGALTWDVGGNAGTPWQSPLSGTVHAFEMYDGVYDFSGRWGDVPLPPPGPVDSLEVIQVGFMRVWRDANDLNDVAIQYSLPPAGYRHIDYRLNPPEKERLMYEVWIDGQQAGYAVDADHGIRDCSLMPGGECVDGESIPVRPFRYS